ncbi:bifunctional DNA primase/polymerase [Pseudonocardia parietis]|uniref:DNA primase/polymerase bifunctional N-terminal domain-containing protein n=1 Tax=Pseudonocardia parietis TaxID=570936 RepID=A0ABS4W123_9PSEU|nr:bifunctional DNA primase/polymerase [Pseudonocardia parietis]MBP2369907.1 hypothetical protein [Pseudonocardia parietis]
MAVEILRAALSHAARGWRVFPLRVGDKRPAIRNWESRATTDPARIRRAWARAPFGIGIACGPSGLVVVDLDGPKPDTVRPPEWDRPGIRDGADVLAVLAEQHTAEVPVETYSVQTASGGEHLYFSAPAGSRIRNSAGRLGWLIDVRAAARGRPGPATGSSSSPTATARGAAGRAGYVVAAGSVVRGRRYRAAEAPVAALPGWIAGLLEEPRLRRADFAPLLEVVGRRSAYVAAALRAELGNVLAARPGSGQRNDTLNRAAFALGQLVGAGLLPDGLATAALAEASAAIGLPAGEAHATIRSGLTAGARTPRRTALEEKA